MNVIKLTILAHDDEYTLRLLTSFLIRKNTRLMTDIKAKVNGVSVCLACLDHHDSRGGTNGSCPSCELFLDMNPDPWNSGDQA